MLFDRLSRFGLPPDVRRWLCRHVLPGLRLRRLMCGGALPRRKRCSICLGYAPWFGLWLSKIHNGQSPHEGHSPRNNLAPYRRGRATAAHQAAKPKPKQHMTAKPRLTSGGKAGVGVPVVLKARLYALTRSVRAGTAALPVKSLTGSQIRRHATRRLIG